MSSMLKSSSKSKLTSLVRSKSAQVIPLLIIVGVMAIMAGSAFILSDGFGSEISGYASYGPLDGCNISFNTPGQYHSLSGDIVCNAGDHGFNISASDVTFDCGGYSITGTANHGIWINASNVNVTNCKISGFGNAIEVDSTYDNIDSINIYNNILTGTGADIEIREGSNEITILRIWDNSFYGNGILGFDDVEVGTFNVSTTDPSSSGNFYRSGISSSRIPNTDGGRVINVTYYGNTTSIAGDVLYNQTTINVTWQNQSAADLDFVETSYNAITYNVQYRDNITNIWTSYDNISTTYYAFGIGDYAANTILEFRVIPFTSQYNESPIETGQFITGGDSDGDGYSSNEFFSDPSYSEYWAEPNMLDCNEDNNAVVPVENWENDTSGFSGDLDGSNFCFDAIDEDCDGNIDWLSNGCGHGFSAGSFYSTLWTNASIINLSTSETNQSGRSSGYYVAVENDYGLVEYTTLTNLSTINLVNFFNITNNSVSVNSYEGDQRFNKSAYVRIKSLNYNSVPIVLKDGEPCSDLVCTNIAPRFGYDTDFNQYRNISFDVSQFSTYTTTASSRLDIFNHNDSESSFLSDDYPKSIETYQRVRFFANYSQYLNGNSVNNLTGDTPEFYHGGHCLLTIHYPNNTVIPGSLNVTMEYDTYNGVYWQDINLYNFSIASSYYKYNISCNSTVYEDWNATQTFTVTPDVTEPMAPTLYPQIILHPTNKTGVSWTEVSGFFNESDINATIKVMQTDTTHYYSITNSTNFTGNYSVYRGQSDVIVLYDAIIGDTVVFIEWTVEEGPETMRKLASHNFIEFSSHNRSHFDRYQISDFERSGNEIRINLTEPLEGNVSVFDTIRLYNGPYPQGYFRMNITLFSGPNRIAVWGEDISGNEGLASIDYINGPYDLDAPSTPVIWDLPEAIRFNESPEVNLTVYGYINESSLENINMTINAKQGSFFNLTFNESFKHSYIRAQATVSQVASNGSNYFQITDAQYDAIGAGAFPSMWVEFSNHNRTYWYRYNVTNTTNNPGEDARIYISPVLEESLTSGITASFYNDTYIDGYFEINMTYNWMAVGLNEVYAVAFRKTVPYQKEGPKSDSQFIFVDSKTPYINNQTILNFSAIREPTITFNVSDNYKVNISSLVFNITNSTWSNVYAYNSSVFPSISIVDNISCTDYYFNASLYECSFTFNRTENGTYAYNVSVADIAGWKNYSIGRIVILSDSIDIISVTDEDDIHQNNWLYANWTYGAGELQEFEFALGNATYPNPGFDSYKNWTSTCNTTSCTDAFVNLTHQSNAALVNSSTIKMKTGTVYYFSVRAKDLSGNYGTEGSSDGILFIDPTPPACVGGGLNCVNDSGSYTNSDSQLYATWSFIDNESDIISYMYSIGTALYPNVGFESVVPRTEISAGTSSITASGLSLTEGETYYFNVKAKNGNSVINFNGSWSQWAESNGITVDLTQPYGGSLNYTIDDWASIDYLTITYNTGDDALSRVGSASLVGGQTPLQNGECVGPILDLDEINESLALGGTNIEYNVTNGYCYAFRLDVVDNAGNVRQYISSNGTFPIVKVDSVGPSTISAVTDDGFFTFDRTQLHATWPDVEDAESGRSHYMYEIFQDNTALADDCNITGAEINCTRAYTGNVTNNDLNIVTNLIHNYKYYIAITPFDYAGNNGTRVTSDGIIYIDNAAPESVVVYSVNDVNTTPGPFVVNTTSGQINITAYGDSLGYPDISQCVLLQENIDYNENAGYTSVLSNCTHRSVTAGDSSVPDWTLTLTNDTARTITQINCTNFTDANDGSVTVQGSWTWYISCRDQWWNYHSSSQNTPVDFTVDWQEAPNVSAFITPLVGDFPVYSDDSLVCTATLSDNESNLNTSNVTFNWYQGNNLLVTEHTTATSAGNSSYVASSTLPSGWTYRGNNITCNVYAYDTTALGTNFNTSVIINNTPPSNLIMVDPNGITINGNDSFWWSGPTDTVDEDFFTLVVEVDNQTNLEFNYSDNPIISYKPNTRMTVGSVEIPGPQFNASVYRNSIAYVDNRSGDLDIYLYHTNNDSEVPVATSGVSEFNPMVYGNYVIYEQYIDPSHSAVFRFDMSTFENSRLITSINASVIDYFGSKIAYNDGDGLKMFDIVSGGSEIEAVPNATINRISLYGNNILYINTTNHINIYDYNNRSSYFTGHSVGSSTDRAELFGYFMVYENAGTLTIVNMIDHTTKTRTGGNFSLYGGKLAFTTGGHVVVADLMNDSIYNVSLSNDGNNPFIYDQVVVWEYNNDLYYTIQNTTLPASFITEDPISATQYYMIDTSDSLDQVFYWKLKACDSSYHNNSCMYGYNYSDYSDPTASNFTYFSVDNAAPVISGVSPTDSSVVAGMFRIHAKIVDSPYGDSYPSYVTYANYSISYENGTIFASGDLSRSATTWSSSYVDFTNISLSNFNLLITAYDYMNNIESSTTQFTINENASWFVFGTGDDEITVDGLSTFNSTINSDMITYTVTNSNLRIIGPLPTTTIRYVKSMSNLTVTNHNYSDPISTWTWPDGQYSIQFTGTNYDGTRSENRTFFVDKYAPKYYNATSIPSVVYASDIVTLSINWTDSTLTEVNITYNNTNMSNSTQLVSIINGSSRVMSSGIYNVTNVRVWNYINHTFNWSSTARDKENRLNNSLTTEVFQISVLDNPPTFTGTIADTSINEDDNTSWSNTLSSLFSDNNTETTTAGDYTYLDNLTYSATYDTSKISVTMNSTTGDVTHVAGVSDFNGTAILYFNATDYYGETVKSNNITITVIGLADTPTLVSCPTVIIDEDNTTETQLQLSSCLYDPDGDPGLFTYAVMPTDTDVFTFTHNGTSTGIFNFTTKENQFGNYSLQFRITDPTGQVGYGNVSVVINDVNDAPTHYGITSPLNNTYHNATINITWNEAIDPSNEGQTVNYSLEYSTDGTTFNLIANYTSVGTNEYFPWNSISAIPTNASVTLRLNATDGVNVSTYVYGNFTVDNQQPTITVNTPTTVMIGSEFTTDIITSEYSTCRYSINATNPSSVLNQTETSGSNHYINITPTNYNSTFVLYINCTDLAGNENTTTKTFESRENPVEFISITAVPEWTYLGQTVNLTLSIASNDSITALGAGIIDFTVSGPGGSSQDFDETNFTPEINESNKISYVNGISSVSAPSVGVYNVTINMIQNDAGAVTRIGPLARIDDVFEVFEAVNQTLIIN